METRQFALGADGRLTPIEMQAALDGWSSGEGVFWIDVLDPDPGAHEQRLGHFGIDGGTVQHILEPGHAARVLPLEKGVFFEYPTGVAGDPPELKYVDCVSIDRALITFRSRDSSTDTWLDAKETTQIVAGEATSSALVSSLLLASSVHLRALSSHLRIGVLAFARELDRDGEGADRDRLSALKREIIDVDAVCEESIAVLEGLDSLRELLLAPEQTDSRFGVALSNTRYTARRMDRLDRRAIDLQGRLDSAQQDKMNRRLSRLTVISAVFLPLTLIAGIYGMNFDQMPELHWRLGYPVALGVMLAIAVGMYAWFRKRGWME